MLFTSTTRPLFNSPLISTTTTTTRRPLFHRTSFLTTNQIKMATTSIVEHVVLFNTKPTADSTQLSAMVNGLNSLRNLPMVLHLSTTKLHRNRSSSLNFTHILHSRYRTKEDLANYSASPDHLSVVRSKVLPITDDIMAVDWVASNFDGPVEIKPGSAVRVQLIKLKDEGKERGKSEVVEVIDRVKKKICGVEQISIGENFSAERAKGFEICSVRVFGGVEDVEDALDADEEIAKEVEKEKEKVRGFIDSLVVVDYVVPNLQSSNL